MDHFGEREWEPLGLPSLGRNKLDFFLYDKSFKFRLLRFALHSLDLLGGETALHILKRIRKRFLFSGELDIHGGAVERGNSSSRMSRCHFSSAAEQIHCEKGLRIIGKLSEVLNNSLFHHSDFPSQ